MMAISPRDQWVHIYIQQLTFEGGIWDPILFIFFVYFKIWFVFDPLHSTQYYVCWFKTLLIPSMYVHNQCHNPYISQLICFIGYRLGTFSIWGLVIMYPGPINPQSHLAIGPFWDPHWQYITCMTTNIRPWDLGNTNLIYQLNPLLEHARCTLIKFSMLVRCCSDAILTRDQYGYGFSQWEMLQMLHCNIIISHWLGPCPEWSLLTCWQLETPEGMIKWCSAVWLQMIKHQDISIQNADSIPLVPEQFYTDCCF